MNTSIFIHYENEENSNELELKTLCRSLLGFESLLREFFKISKLQADIEIKAKASKDGSYVEWIILGFDFFNSLPFENLSDFLEYVQVIDLDLYGEATAFFNTNGFDSASMNEFFTNVLNGETKAQVFANDSAKNRPAEYDLIKWVLYSLTTAFFLKIFSKSKEVKNQLKPDSNTSVRVFKALKNLIRRGLAKRAIAPFVENEVEKIGFSRNGRKVEIDTIIDRKNFGNLLPDSEEVLPDYINGSIHRFKGEVRNFHSARGDFMKIKVNLDKDGDHILIVKPDEEHETKDFRNFYKENVAFRAEVLRESFFEKPKLKIIGTMELIQEELFPEENNKST